MTTDTNQIDDIKIQYNSLIQLTIYEGQLIWSVFSNLLAVNSFIIAFSVAILSVMGQYKLISIIFSILGLVICCIWLISTKRMFSYYDFRFACLRECEKQLFSDDKCYIEKGSIFARGDTVRIDEVEKSMKGLNRLITNQTVIKAVIIFISLIYITTLFLATVENKIP